MARVVNACLQTKERKEKKLVEGSKVAVIGRGNRDGPGKCFPTNFTLCTRDSLWKVGRIVGNLTILSGLHRRS